MQDHAIPKRRCSIKAEAKDLFWSKCVFLMLALLMEFIFLTTFGIQYWGVPTSQILFAFLISERDLNPGPPEYLADVLPIDLCLLFYRKIVVLIWTLSRVVKLFFQFQF